MAIEIIGRVGAKAYALSVDSLGRMQALVAAESEDRRINELNGKVWSIDMDSVTGNAGVYVAWFQNTSQEFYHLTNMRSHCQDAASIIDIDSVSVGTIGNNTAFLPASVTSRKIGNSSMPVGNMDFTASSTGLTGLTKLSNLFHAGDLDDRSSHLKISSSLIMPPGSALAVKLITANATNGLTITWSLVEVLNESQ